MHFVCKGMPCTGLWRNCKLGRGLGGGWTEGRRWCGATCSEIRRGRNERQDKWGSIQKGANCLHRNTVSWKHKHRRNKEYQGHYSDPCPSPRLGIRPVRAPQPRSAPAPSATTPLATPCLRLDARVGRGGGGGRVARKCSWRVPAALGIVGDSANGVGESRGLGEAALKLLSSLAGDNRCKPSLRQRERLPAWWAPPPGSAEPSRAGRLRGPLG